MPISGKKMTIFVIFIIIMLASIMPARPEATIFKVVAVYDGDTIKAEGHGTVIKVRLACIDAPEASGDVRKAGQPYSREAKAYLAGLILNKMVEIKGYGYHSHDLVFGEIFFEGKNINLEIVKAGLAEVYDKKVPAGLDLAPYYKAERASKDANRGMWAQGDRYASPAKWREKKSSISAIGILLYGLHEQQGK
ncbi:thermonuclease family protein [Thermodesulfobacteriota bacterium]